MSNTFMRHLKTIDQVMWKQAGFLRTEIYDNETKKKLDERLPLTLLGYKIVLDLGLFKFRNFDLGSNH